MLLHKRVYLGFGFNKRIKDIILKTAIMTEMDKLWQRKGALSPEEVDIAYNDMEAKTYEVLQNN